MALRTTRQMVEALGTSDGGELRVTRQTVAVAAEGSGVVRVYRQMIEVLAAEAGGAIYEESAINAIALTAQATRQAVLSLDIDSDLDLSQDAAGSTSHIYEASAETALDLDHEGYLNLEGSGVLSLDDSVAVSVAWGRAASSAETLDEATGFLAVYRRPAASTLSLSDQLNVVGPINQSVTSGLELAQTARKCDVLFASAGSTASISGMAAAHGTIHLQSASALSMQSMADLGIFNRAAVSEIGLSETAVGDYCHGAVSHIELESTAVKGQITVSASSNLTIDHDVRGNPITFGPGPEYDVDLPATAIQLSDAATSSIRMLVADNIITVSDQLDVKRPWHVLAENALATTSYVYDPVSGTLVEVVEGLKDSADTSRIHTVIGVHQYLQPTGAAAVVKLKSTALNLSAESGLAVDHDLFINETGIAASFLPLFDLAVVDKCVPIDTEVVLTDTASVAIIRSSDLASSLNLQQAMAYVVIGSTIPYRYCPMVGAGADDAPTPPPTTLDGPIDGVTDPFKLLYPPVGTVQDSLVIRAPNLGNKDRLSFNRVLRETRGGTLVVYADPIWPKIQTLVLSFSGLRSDETQALMAFLGNHLGLEIGLLDWEHRYWRGVITTPDDPIVQDGPDSFSASFEFEGQLDPTWTL